MFLKREKKGKLISFIPHHQHDTIPEYASCFCCCVSTAATAVIVPWSQCLNSLGEQVALAIRVCVIWATCLIFDTILIVLLQWRSKNKINISRKKHNFNSKVCLSGFVRPVITTLGTKHSHQGDIISLLTTQAPSFLLNYRGSENGLSLNMIFVLSLFACLRLSIML